MMNFNSYKIENIDCNKYIENIEDESIDLIVSSPPYNIGKEYEFKQELSLYLESYYYLISQFHRILKKSGSICWQVGNYINKSSVIPLDYVFYPIFDKNNFIMRNRIIWHFEHGLHCKKRFSGRNECIMWLTKTDDYYYDLDSVRVPQKYPNKKHYKGPNAGKLSCNPLGKNPGDVWSIPNVKNNHPEKTEHPCQFPEELVSRLVKSLCPEDGIVFDPFLGSGTTAVAALKNKRKILGTEINKKYFDICNDRVEKFLKITESMVF